MVSGRFLIDDITFASSALQSLSARFEEHCEGGDLALFGAISFHSTADYRTASLSPRSLILSTQNGQPVSQNLTMTNNGPAALTPGGFTISPSNAGFTISGTTCSGSLAAGAS